MFGFLPYNWSLLLFYINPSGILPQTVRKGKTKQSHQHQNPVQTQLPKCCRHPAPKSGPRRHFYSPKQAGHGYPTTRLFHCPSGPWAKYALLWWNDFPSPTPIPQHLLIVLASSWYLEKLSPPLFLYLIVLDLFIFFLDTLPFSFLSSWQIQVPLLYFRLLSHSFSRWWNMLDLLHS